MLLLLLLLLLLLPLLLLLLFAAAVASAAAAAAAPAVVAVFVPIAVHSAGVAGIAFILAAAAAAARSAAPVREGVAAVYHRFLLNTVAFILMQSSNDSCVDRHTSNGRLCWLALGGNALHLAACVRGQQKGVT